ncbi:helix-turn-helix transcriptional regulator [Streptomyces sp. NPDC026294]|uniref:helix-turn-helix domain-containing protein n=1 Tax=Streptomyces sp. NPDC026294 TaxID=3155362 RepID=UPI0033C3D958
MDTRGNTDPAEARDVAEFLAMLRELKERRGLTYRQFEQRAAEQGEVLARSTLADVLSGRRLPRPEILSVFVRACGESGDRATAWRRRPRGCRRQGPHGEDGTRPGGVGRDGTDAAPCRCGARGRRSVRTHNRNRRPALAAVPPHQDPQHPARASPDRVGDRSRPGHRRLDGDLRHPDLRQPASDPAPQPEAPSRNAAVPAGWIRIRPAAAPTLCVTDGRVQDGRYASLVAVQRPCGGVAPQRTELEPVGTDTYRIAWVHPSAEGAA